MAEITLRPWQAQALQKAENWFLLEKQRHFLINAAPGAGKTICASVIAKRLIDKGAIERVIVIAPRTEVVRQWGDDFQKITGRTMTKVTGIDIDVSDYGDDVCATWNAIQALATPFHHICRTYKTLVICDEHHHAAVEAVWGQSAGSAFEKAAHSLILTGTPIRSDNKDTVWLAFDSEGQVIDLPDAGTFTLTYGEAVDRGYCRPITFHRHEGNFTVTLPDGEGISVSSKNTGEISSLYKDIPGLKQALNFFKLACMPKYKSDNSTADPDSFLGSMVDWGICKLEDIRDTVPNAGGLVIAPNIIIAEHIAELLEIMTGEKPVIVHNNTPNSEGRISSFRKSHRRWIVSVAMISEGVDIPRLRVLLYIPNAKTELAFRQSMGRVVRSLGDDDFSRAYVVMPALDTLEVFARRVESEMSPGVRAEKPITLRICPICGGENERGAVECIHCGHEFPPRQGRHKPCPTCEELNPFGATSCAHCGENFSAQFEVTLRDALRVGAIIRGMDLEEDEVQDSEAMAKDFREFVLGSGDDVLVKLMRDVPLEAIVKIAKFAEARKKNSDDSS